jgi:hypothetical protein
MIMRPPQQGREGFRMRFPQIIGAPVGDWQAHVYGQARSEIEQACAVAGLDLRRFPWNAAAEIAGIARDAFYLIRPDGYVGLAAASAEAVIALRDYQTRLGIVFGDATQSSREPEMTSPALP